MKVQVVCKSKHLKVKDCLYYNIVPHSSALNDYFITNHILHHIFFSDLAHSAFNQLSDLCAYFCLHTLKLSPVSELELGVDDPGFKGKQRRDFIFSKH